MRWMLAALTVALLVLAGCTSTVVGQPQGSPTAASPGASAPGGSPSADVGQCFDGACEITVSSKIDIPLDGRFGVTSLTAEVTRTGQVQLAYEGLGGRGRSSVGGLGTVSFGGLVVRILSNSGGTAVLRLAPR